MRRLILSFFPCLTLSILGLLFVESSKCASLFQFILIGVAIMTLMIFVYVETFPPQTDRNSTSV